jgi:hypothetical protein
MDRSTKVIRLASASGELAPVVSYLLMSNLQGHDKLPPASNSATWVPQEDT